MKSSTFVFPAAIALLLAGCSTPPPRTAAPVLSSAPVSEIPDYAETDEAFDVSASVAVYPTLWVSQPISLGLGQAGYKVVGASQVKNEPRVVPPDFIVEPLSFKHWLEARRDGTWLFTRLVLQVRRPVRVATDETGLAPQPEPRVFQVYARRNIGSAQASEAEYRKNVSEAVENLMHIREFRKALEKSSGGAVACN